MTTKIDWTENDGGRSSLRGDNKTAGDCVTRAATLAIHGLNPTGQQYGRMWDKMAQAQDAHCRKYGDRYHPATPTADKGIANEASAKVLAEFGWETQGVATATKLTPDHLPNFPCLISVGFKGTRSRHMIYWDGKKTHDTWDAYESDKNGNPTTFLYRIFFPAARKAEVAEWKETARQVRDTEAEVAAAEADRFGEMRKRWQNRKRRKDATPELVAIANLVGYKRNGVECLNRLAEVREAWDAFADQADRYTINDTAAFLTTALRTATNTDNYNKRKWGIDTEAATPEAVEALAAHIRGETPPAPEVAPVATTETESGQQAWDF